MLSFLTVSVLWLMQQQRKYLCEEGKQLVVRPFYLALDLYPFHGEKLWLE